MLLTLPLAAQVNLAPVGMPSGTAETAMSVIQPHSANFTAERYQESTDLGHNFYRWTVAAVVVANSADAATSWKAQEANPLVAGTGTQFGVVSLVIKSGFVATSLLIQDAVLRHRPDWRKRMAWMNLATAGVLSQVVSHNLHVR